MKQVKFITLYISKNRDTDKEKRGTELLKLTQLSLRNKNSWIEN